MSSLPASGGTQLLELPEVDSPGGKAGEGPPWGLCWGARPRAPLRWVLGAGCRAGTRRSHGAARTEQRVPGVSEGGTTAQTPPGARAQDQGGSPSREVGCLPLENVTLFAAVLWELYIPNRIGGVLLPSHCASLGFPTSFNFLSICLVAALSRNGSMGSRRNQVFIFRPCKKSSTQGKCNYFRLHAGF